MQRLLFILLLIGLCNYAEANQTIRGVNLGPVANSEVGEESQRFGDGDQGIQPGGNVLGSFRRTATRLREHDGLTPSASFDRSGLDWTRGAVASRTTGRGSTITTREARESPITVPVTARNYMLYFTMPGCKACKVMQPIIEGLQNAGQEIYIVERSSNSKLVEQYDVEAYPTMVVFNQGKEVKTYVGVVTAKALTDYLEPWTPDTDNSEVDYDFVDGPSVNYKLW